MTYGYDDMLMMTSLWWHGYDDVVMMTWFIMMMCWQDSECVGQHGVNDGEIHKQPGGAGEWENVAVGGGENQVWEPAAADVTKVSERVLEQAFFYKQQFTNVSFVRS